MYILIFYFPDYSKSGSHIEPYRRTSGRDDGGRCWEKTTPSIYSDTKFNRLAGHRVIGDLHTSMHRTVYNRIYYR